MNFHGLKKLSGQWVNIWPRPVVVPTGKRAQMQWHVARVDRNEGVVELHAPSGHFFNAADVIHHCQQQGQELILNAQVVIDSSEIKLQPRPWKAAPQAVPVREQPARVPPRPRSEPDWRPLLFLAVGVALGRAFGR